MIQNVVTDGKTIGLAAYLTTVNSWLQDPRGSILYRNLEVIKSALNYAGFTDPRSYVIFIKVDNILIELSKCKKTEDGYIFFNNEDKYYVTEDRDRRLCSMGYISFYTDSYKKNLSAAFNACMKLGMRKVKWTYNSKVLRFKMFKNSGAINICSISTLVDINNKRKADGIKAIPFTKDKRNNNLVIFSDKDMYDKRCVEEELASQIYDIISEINKSSSETITYEPVDVITTTFLSD